MTFQAGDIIRPSHRLRVELVTTTHLVVRNPATGKVGTLPASHLHAWELVDRPLRPGCGTPFDQLTEQAA